MPASAKASFLCGQLPAQVRCDRFLCRAGRSKNDLHATTFKGLRRAVTHSCTDDRFAAFQGGKNSGMIMRVDIG